MQGKELCTLLHLGVVAIEKGAFGSPSTKVANFYYIVLVTFISTHEISGHNVEYLLNKTKKQILWNSFGLLTTHGW